MKNHDLVEDVIEIAIELGSNNTKQTRDRLDDKVLALKELILDLKADNRALKSNIQTLGKMYREYKDKHPLTAREKQRMEWALGKRK